MGCVGHRGGKCSHKNHGRTQEGRCGKEAEASWGDSQSPFVVGGFWNSFCVFCDWHLHCSQQPLNKCRLAGPSVVGKVPQVILYTQTHTPRELCAAHQTYLPVVQICICSVCWSVLKAQIQGGTQAGSVSILKVEPRGLLEGMHVGLSKG